MKKVILTIMLSLAYLSGSCLANAASSQPDKCPSVSAIKSVGLHRITELRGGSFGVEAGADYKYDTSDAWLFTIIVPKTTREHALELGNQALSSLRFVAGPHLGGRYGMTWVCDYSNDKGYAAGTVKRS